jgi:aspartyl protease family protein
MSGVDAFVVETGLPVALLGMSFLNRTEMKREGETMVLIKRF